MESVWSKSMCICVNVLIYNCNYRIIIPSGKFMYIALASSGLYGGTPCLHNPHIGIAVDNLGPDKGVGLSILHEPPDHKPNQTANVSEQQSPKKEQERKTDDKYTPTPAHKYGERIR